MKETFIIRTEWMEAIFELDPIDQATIFRNLFIFHSGNDEPIILNNLSTKLVWKLIEPNLIRNIDSYDKRRFTSSENGLNGGRPEKVLFSSFGVAIPRNDANFHFVYLMKNTRTGLHKIGETKNIFKRRLSIKEKTENLSIVHFVEVEKSVAIDTERKVLEAFNRAGGDWLDIDKEDIDKIINILNNPWINSSFRRF